MGVGWDIPVRMIAATLLVLIITEVAPSLGSKLSGLLTPFPVYTSILAASIQRRNGAASAVQFVRGATIGLFTPAVFFLIVGSLIEGWGVVVSFVLATVASIIIHWFLLGILSKSS